MDETEFWEIIDSTRAAADGDPEEQADLLIERLALLDPDAVTDFARHFETRFARAFLWDVWSAADIMLGGADDEAFAFLVAEFDTEVDGDAEELGYAADEAYEQLTGVRLPDLELPPAGDPEGEQLDMDDTDHMADRFPKLWARFGSPARRGCTARLHGGHVVRNQIFAEFVALVDRDQSAFDWGCQSNPTGLRRPEAKTCASPVARSISRMAARFFSASRPFSATLLFEPTPT